HDPPGRRRHRRGLAGHDQARRRRPPRRPHRAAIGRARRLNMTLQIELKLLDPRLPQWGFPNYGSDLAAGRAPHACFYAALVLRPQAPAVLISTGIAFRIGDPHWCALILPRSGLGHRTGLVLGNAVGLIDADYEGTCFVSAWNRNRPDPRGAGSED